MSIDILDPRLSLRIAMTLWLIAALAECLGRKRAGGACFATGFVAVLCAFALRWFEAGHVPMQTMFEVFLCLAVAVWPMAAFWRRVLRVDRRGLDPLIGTVILFPAAFVFPEAARPLPPALQSPLFVPHVLAYLLSYTILFRANLAAFSCVLRAKPEDEESAHRLVRFGFPLMTLGLVLGSIWGKVAWGDYWNWDPKELWSLAAWLAFLVYLHVRSATGRERSRLNASLVVLGGALIVMGLLWVNLAPKLFSGLHNYAT